jgi:hypothetical protein
MTQMAGSGLNKGSGAAAGSKRHRERPHWPDRPSIG